MSVFLFEAYMEYKHSLVHFDHSYLVYINTDWAVFTAIEDPYIQLRILALPIPVQHLRTETRYSNNTAPDKIYIISERWANLTCIFS